MSRRLMRTAHLLTAMVALSAARPSADQEALASAAPFIDRANADWVKAIVAGNADVMSAPYDVTGIMVAPDGSVYRGRSAVRRLYLSRKPGVKVLHASIHSDGRNAHGPSDVYEWGTASMTIRAGSVTRNQTGRYLTVWHRKGSAWVITRNLAL